MNPHAKVNPKTVKLISRYLNILSDEGIIGVIEANSVVANLKHLAKEESLLPPIAIAPKLLTMEGAASILGIALSNFKKLEKQGSFPFKRKMVGSSVRFRNTDIYTYVMQEDDLEENEQ